MRRSVAEMDDGQESARGEMISSELDGAWPGRPPPALERSRARPDKCTDLSDSSVTH